MVIMKLVCSECNRNLFNPYLALISAYKGGELLQEGPGLGVCFSHLEGISEVGAKPKEKWKMSDGLLYLLDKAVGSQNENETIDDTADTWRTERLGYMTVPEVKLYFPKSYQLIETRKPGIPLLFD